MIPSLTALRAYIQHKPMCPQSVRVKLDFGPGWMEVAHVKPCTCGLQALLDAAGEGETRLLCAVCGKPFDKHYGLDCDAVDPSRQFASAPTAPRDEKQYGREQLMEQIGTKLTAKVDGLDAVRSQEYARGKVFGYCEALHEILALLTEDNLASTAGTWHPIAKELHEALRVILSTVRGDEKSSCWTIRRYLDKRDIYNGDLGSSERLIEAACKYALKLPLPAPPEGETETT